MPEPAPRSPLAGLAVIGAVVLVGAGGFAYAGGWLSPGRITPGKVIDTFDQVPGHRANHATGICFTGTFEASGDMASVSRAALFARGRYPVVGRFNLAGPNPHTPDDKGRVRGFSIQVKGPGGSEWRSAMIIPPFFPVATPDAFYDLQVASGSKDSGAMPAFIAKHPEFKPFGQWAMTAPWTPSFAENQFNSLNAFRAIAPDGGVSVVRWSVVPTVPVESITPEELGKRGPDALDVDLRTRLAAGPIRYTLQFTKAAPGDPTADPSQAWPAGRPTVNAGSIVVERLEEQADGPCRFLNYDPTILPDGLEVSDDPFPSARSAAYSVSYNRRAAAAADYPR